jgi:hypothetical protein
MRQSNSFWQFGQCGGFVASSICLSNSRFSTPLALENGLHAQTKDCPRGWSPAGVVLLRVRCERGAA